MKKIICALLIALSLVTLCACGTSPADNNGGTSQPNIKEVNVGDEFLAYPDVSFTYTYVKRTYPNPNDPTEVEETRYVIQITEAKLVLTKKNTIAKDESIAGKFYPYVAKLTVKGKTDAALSGKAIQITYLWRNFGYDMLLWKTGIDAIDGELYQAAALDGAGFLKQFRYITLPQLKDMGFVIVVISVINSFKVFREAYLIGGDYPNQSIYMLQHLFNNWFVRLELGKLTAAAVMLALVVFLFIAVVERILVPKEK